MEDAYSMASFAAMLSCGIALLVFFVIKPLETVLFYFASSTVLQLFNEAWIQLPMLQTRITFGGVMLSIILLLSIIALLTNKEKRLKHIRMINVCFISFIVWMFASSLFNAGAIELTAAVKELGRITGVYVLFLLGYKYAKTAQDIKRFNIALFASLVVPIFVSLYQIVMGTEYIKIEKYNRVYGTFGIPNMWAMYLILPMILMLMMSLRKKTIDFRKLLSLGIIGFLSTMLFFTYTRASWLAFLVACIYISWKKYKRLLPYLIIGLLLLLTFASMESLRLGSSGSSGRTGLWAALFPVGLSSPIVGHGITSMSHVSKTLFGSNNQGQNQYLLYWIEGGLGGVALFMILLYSIFRKFRESYRKIQNNYLKDAVFGQIAFFLGMITIAVFESNALFQSWVWLSSGIVLGVCDAVLQSPDAALSPLRDTFYDNFSPGTSYEDHALHRQS